jgi:hypothetical protein
MTHARTNQREEATMKRIFLAVLIMLMGSFSSPPFAQQQQNVRFTCHANPDKCYFSVYYNAGLNGTRNFTLRPNESTIVPGIVLGRDWYSVALNRIPPAPPFPVHDGQTCGTPQLWCKGPLRINGTDLS